MARMLASAPSPYLPHTSRGVFSAVHSEAFDDEARMPHDSISAAKEIGNAFRSPAS